MDQLTGEKELGSAFMNRLPAVQALEREKYYYLCSAGVGDTMLLCGMLAALEDKLGGTIHLLIKRSHEFLMDMYGIREYTIIDFTGLDLPEVSKACRKPERGRIYLAHPHVHRELESFFVPIRDQNAVFRFMPWFTEFLGLPSGTAFRPPERVPELDGKLKARCETLAPLEKIAVFSPEATSMPAIPMMFWRELAGQLRKRGIHVVSNVMRPENCVPGTYYLPMSAADAVAMGYRCKDVYSLRSGYCDALYLLGSRLHALYPSHSSLYIYSLNEMFGRDDIDERLILQDMF